jgi:hypothetical protein
MSEHDLENPDGLLSMWRGYGGNGKGAALVFDMAKVDLVEDSPFLIRKVLYGSDAERLRLFDRIASIFAHVLAENHIPNEKIHVASQEILERIKFCALFIKHVGFKEEKEWRAVHMSDRARKGQLRSMQHYVNGSRGVEPKLKLKFEHIEGITPPGFSLEKILLRILLGPSTSSHLAVQSVKRMLDLIERPELKDKLFASSIPLRAN